MALANHLSQSSTLPSEKRPLAFSFAFSRPVTVGSMWTSAKGSATSTSFFETIASSSSSLLASWIWRRLKPSGGPAAFTGSAVFAGLLGASVGEPRPLLTLGASSSSSSSLASMISMRLKPGAGCEACFAASGGAFAACAAAGGVAAGFGAPGVAFDGCPSSSSSSLASTICMRRNPAGGSEAFTASGCLAGSAETVWAASLSSSLSLASTISIRLKPVGEGAADRRVFRALSSSASGCSLRASSTSLSACSFRPSFSRAMARR
mmetsp:Transcript_7300/g.16822  ORF Transcript_7300/g.16822 Transcript_7300/m.16822 type:complete len:264 (-) Transcript_7300:571-1362(-)